MRCGKTKPASKGPALAGLEAGECAPDARRPRVCVHRGRREGSPSRSFSTCRSRLRTRPSPSPKQWRGKSGLNDYADFVMQTDATVGRVLESLEKSGAADKDPCRFSPATTAALPTPERRNSRKKGHFPSGPLRGYKADAWEGGHRVPFIVRWPGIVKPATRCDALVATDGSHGHPRRNARREAPRQRGRRQREPHAAAQRRR